MPQPPGGKAGFLTVAKDIIDFPVAAMSNQHLEALAVALVSVWRAERKAVACRSRRNGEAGKGCGCQYGGYEKLADH